MLVVHFLELHIFVSSLFKLQILHYCEYYALLIILKLRQLPYLYQFRALDLLLQQIKRYEANRGSQNSKNYVGYIGDVINDLNYHRVEKERPNETVY